MYRTIMVPVDLSHPERLQKALDTTADLAKHYDAAVTLVGVTTSQPTSVAHTFAEYERKLADFAAAEGGKRGVTFVAKAVMDPDPVIDLDDLLREQAHVLDADLVVMASHVPHFGDYLIGSQSGHFAHHTDTALFIVR